MNKLDIKSVIIGILGTVLVFVSIGAANQDKNFGNITVSSLTVLDENKFPSVIIETIPNNGGLIYIRNSKGGLTSHIGVSGNYGGYIGTYNSDGKQTSTLGTGESGGGHLSTFNSDGKQTSFLGTDGDGGGHLETFNKHEILVGYFGSSMNKDGLIYLNDRYGDVGWAKDGKK